MSEAAVGFKYYFTGPVTWDPALLLIVGPVVLLVLFLIWKWGKFKWPNF